MHNYHVVLSYKKHTSKPMLIQERFVLTIGAQFHIPDKGVFKVTELTWFCEERVPTAEVVAEYLDKGTLSEAGEHYSH